MNLADALNNVRIIPSLDGIVHEDEKRIEFLFAFLIPDSEWASPFVDRSFQVHFKNTQIECRFAEPTARMMELAKAAHSLPSDNARVPLPQIRAFRDFQRLGDLSPVHREYFDKRVPRNFFVHPIPDSINDMIDLFRHINFLSAYYDRASPEIIIRNDETGLDGERPERARLIKTTFPDRLNARTVDDVVLTLLEVARRSTPRHGFVHYYQVFEYAGHYYIDEKARLALRKILRDPAFGDCDDAKLTELFSILSSVHHHDDQRMLKVVEDHCVAENLWPDVQQNRRLYTERVTFDGGCVIEPIVSENVDAASWVPMFNNLLTAFRRIRNCIVHAREKREHSVILPTARNDVLLARYVPLIRRMAEDIAIRT